MTTATLDRIAATRTYDGLVRKFAPRVIRTKAECETAYEIIERLMSVDGPSRDQSEYLELLSSLVERYESLTHPTPTSSLPDLLSHLISSRGVKQVEAARGAGVSPTTLSDVLAGRRSLSIENIKKLAAYFCVDSSLFVDAT